jgi:hypothetical protein
MLPVIWSTAQSTDDKLDKAERRLERSEHLRQQREQNRDRVTEDRKQRQAQSDSRTPRYSKPSADKVKSAPGGSGHTSDNHHKMGAQGVQAKDTPEKPRPIKPRDEAGGAHEDGFPTKGPQRSLGGPKSGEKSIKPRTAPKQEHVDEHDKPNSH